MYSFQDFLQYLEEAKAHGVELPSVKAGLLPYLKDGYYLHFTNYDITVVMPEVKKHKSASSDSTIQGIYGWSLAPTHYGKEYLRNYKSEYENLKKQYESLVKLRTKVEANTKGKMSEIDPKILATDVVDKLYAMKENGSLQPLIDAATEYSKSSKAPYAMIESELDKVATKIRDEVVAPLYKVDEYVQEYSDNFKTSIYIAIELYFPADEDEVVLKDSSWKTERNKTIKDLAIDFKEWLDRAKRDRRDDEDQLDDYEDYSGWGQSFSLKKDETLDQFIGRYAHNITPNKVVFPYGTEGKFAFVFKQKSGINILHLDKPKKLKKVMTGDELVMDILKAVSPAKLPTKADMDKQAKLKKEYESIRKKFVKADADIDKLRKKANVAGWFAYDDSVVKKKLSAEDRKNYDALLKVKDDLRSKMDGMYDQMTQNALPAETAKQVKTERDLHDSAKDVCEQLAGTKYVGNGLQMYALRTYLMKKGYDAVSDMSHGADYLFSGEPYQIAFLHNNAFDVVAMFDNQMKDLIDKGVS